MTSSGYMTSSDRLGETFIFKGTVQTVNRMGYGSMQLTGPMVWGEPRDRPAAISVLKAAIAHGINHIDTSDFYGPHTANKLIKEAISPYPENLVIATKVGFKRGADKSWLKAQSAEDLTNAVHDNLRNLGKETLDIVNLRMGDAMGPNDSSLASPLAVLVKLKEKGLIRNIGLSNVSYRQFKESETITDIVCVQNQYNIANRKDDDFLDELAEKSIAFVPFFPMGGFRPIESDTLEKVAASLDRTPRQVALAWLLQRSRNILLIPGTSSVRHLHENVTAAGLILPNDAIELLNRIGR
jgi:pyridoxine 4-dehydrogenase